MLLYFSENWSGKLLVIDVFLRLFWTKIFKVVLKATCMKCINFKKMYKIYYVTNWGNDQEVEFHEIKIQLFMRSNFWRSWDQIILSLFMRSKFLIMIRSPDHPFFMRSKFKISIIRNFDLMIDLLVTSMIMRSKLK